MWQSRACIVIYVILIGFAAFFDSKSSIGGVEARFFSEGGGFDENTVEKSQQPSDDELTAYYDILLQKEREQQQNAELSQILDELYAQEIAAEQQKISDELSEIQETQKFYEQEKNQQIDEISKGEEEPKTPVVQNQEPPTAQKKGQSEFVEFVEPPQAKILKSVDTFDKRIPAEQIQANPHRGIHLLSTTGNVMFIAIVTMCCVASVVGVVGGVYYYKNRRNPENDFDDFTRYSPAGPAKKLASLRNGVRMDENGDDSLAYKAQLHHYQQTKQKIIGSDESGFSGATSPAGSPRSIHHGENSEDEAEDLEEHNYSVYECPGLAPTGDIEVNNPNFGHH